MNRIKKRWLFSWLGLCLAASTTAYAQSEEPAEIDFDQQRMIEIYHLINQYHVANPESGDLSQGAIWGMIDSLEDPYTEYFTDEEFESFMEEVEGSYSGVGMVMGEMADGYLVVQQVFKGSPAEKAGILAGDKLIAIDGENVVNKPSEDVVGKVKGKENTSVTITVEREGKALDLVVTRGQIELPTVTAKLLDHQIGYIELATFSDEAITHLEQELKTLQEKGLKGLILDLRNNPGGMMSAAVDLTSLFVEKGPIVHVKDNAGYEQSFGATGNKELQKLPLVVLVNENSASSSEIVAAALKDYNLATIIGTQTYGKGVVQELIPLHSGGVLKLTIEEYFSPNHQVINHQGVAPNVLVTDPEEQLQAAQYVLLDNKLTLKPSGEVLINGEQEEGSTVAAFRERGSWYVSLRKMAYLFHGEIGYDPEKGQATLRIAQDTHSIGLKEALIKEGTAYLPLEALLKLYPNVSKQAEADGGITLQ